jgi:hypothetical protein
VNAYATALVADAPLTDAMPSNLGSFAIELTTLTLGGATALTATIRANIELQYEQ